MSQNFAATGTPPMIGQRLTIEAWQAYIQSYSWGETRPTRLVLHHTYRPTEAQWQGLRSMRGMQRFYRLKGWSAAPHIYAAPDGIWLFTPLRDVGVHAGTGNGSRKAGWYSIGLEMVGDFDKQLPAGAVWDNALAVIGELAQVLGIAPRKLISFHRDYTNKKSCPGNAVKPEWVWAEAERWLAAHAGPHAAPANPPSQPEAPLADPAGLPEALTALSYAQRSAGYRADWAFHRAAISQGLGAPVGQSRTISAGAAKLNYQAFGRDVLFCLPPRWAEVHSLAQALAKAPNDPTATAVRAALFRDAAITFDANDPLLAAAADLHAGPPLLAPRPVYIGAQRGRLLVCAADTLFLPEGAHGVVRLSASTGTAAGALFDATCDALGIKHPDGPFTAAARAGGLGAPLSAIVPLAHAGQRFAAQVFALDTLVAADEAGRNLRRLSALAASVPQGKGVPTEPSPVRAIQVQPLQGDAAQLVDVGTQHDLTGAHLLVTRQGFVLPVPRARLQASLANPTTLLVLVDRPEEEDALSGPQSDALTRLLHALEQRYQLPQTAVRWGESLT